MKKLVRDKIPSIIKKEGKNPKFHIANEKDYENFLYKKLIEESKEFNKNPTKEEFSDILEVIDAIGKLNKFDKREILSIKSKKAKTKGKFDKRFISDY